MANCLMATQHSPREGSYLIPANGNYRQKLKGREVVNSEQLFYLGKVETEEKLFSLGNGPGELPQYLCTGLPNTTFSHQPNIRRSRDRMYLTIGLEQVFKRGFNLLGEVTFSKHPLHGRVTSDQLFFQSVPVISPTSPPPPPPSPTSDKITKTIPYKQKQKKLRIFSPFETILEGLLQVILLHHFLEQKSFWSFLDK